MWIRRRKINMKNKVIKVVITQSLVVLVVSAMRLKVVVLSPSHFDKPFTQFRGSNKSYIVGKKSAVFLRKRESKCWQRMIRRRK